VYVDASTGHRSGVLQLLTAAGLEDVSADCRIGVDDHLTLYDLAQGQVVKTITYHADSASHPQLQVSNGFRYSSLVKARFLPRDAMLGTLYWRRYICRPRRLSVCLSHVGIVSKRLNGLI